MRVPSMPSLGEREGILTVAKGLFRFSEAPMQEYDDVSGFEPEIAWPSVPLGTAPGGR
ncbi:MAG TPA: hypothetical protein VGL48_14205 [Acidimicrobiales bacterium]